MAPRPKTEKVSQPSVENFLKKLKTMGESFLGLLMMLARIDMERKNGTVSEATAAFEVFSHIYEADASKRLTLNDWNCSIKKMPVSTPTVRVPLWAFDALARGWGRYQTENGLNLEEALGMRKGRGQGARSNPEKFTNDLRNLEIANQVIQYRIVSNKNGKPISIDEACTNVSAEMGLSFGIVKDAYRFERENCIRILKALGLEIEAHYILLGD